MGGEKVHLGVAGWSMGTVSSFQRFPTSLLPAVYHPQSARRISRASWQLPMPRTATAVSPLGSPQPRVMRAATATISIVHRAP